MAAPSILKKIVIGLVALGVLAFLFASTLRDVASEPYTVQAADLEQWTLQLGMARRPDDPILLLRPPAALPIGLFDQVFQRTMASFSTPAEPGIPLVLRGEFESSVAEVVSASQLLDLARDAGLERAVLVPRCMAVHRTTDGREQQQFFVLFDLPAFTVFRAQVAELVEPRGAATPFDAQALAPVLLVASSQPDRFRPAPPPAVLEQSCEAPVIAG